MSDQQQLKFIGFDVHGVLSGGLFDTEMLAIAKKLQEDKNLAVKLLTSAPDMLEFDDDIRRTFPALCGCKKHSLEYMANVSQGISEEFAFRHKGEELLPEHCLLIDDSATNREVAEGLGWKAVDGHPGQVLEILAEHGIEIEIESGIGPLD
jgi:hypothetical protein